MILSAAFWRRGTASICEMFVVAVAHALSRAVSEWLRAAPQPSPTRLPRFAGSLDFVAFLCPRYFHQLWCALCPCALAGMGPLGAPARGGGGDSADSEPVDGSKSEWHQRSLQYALRVVQTGRIGEGSASGVVLGKQRRWQQWKISMGPEVPEEPYLLL